MGKKPNWFQRLFTSKTSASSSETNDPTSTTKKKKKKWSASFAKSREPPSKETHLSSQFGGASGIDADRHAIAVAAATAAVAEAAVAAARAAAEVVRLTSAGGTSGRSGPSREVAMAAVLIQSAFRGYLARRALRALKSLVKLQALVRGHIVRKQTADMVRRMQALVRVQARARASRAQTSEFSHVRSRSSIPHNPVASPAKHEQRIRINGSTLHQFSNLKRYGTNAYSMDISQDRSYSASTWLDHWMDEFPRTHNRNTLHKDYTGDQEKVVDKILEVDTWKPHLNYKQNSMRNNSPSKYARSFHKPTSSLSSGDNFSLSSKLPEEADEVSSWTGGNSPRVVSASSRLGSGERRSPFSPTRSEYSKRHFNGWPDHPNYMANTASYKAKVRSQSAPRQRADFEKPLSSQRYVHGYNIYQDPANSFDRLSSSSLR